jgi:hypothetical protein
LCCAWLRCSGVTNNALHTAGPGRRPFDECLTSRPRRAPLLDGGLHNWGDGYVA